jgi:hypothetical protein
MTEPYFEGPREHLQSWFRLADVPADVVEADSVTSVVPRVFGTAMIPGIVAEHAARIDVPVRIGYGVIDVSSDPRAEAGFTAEAPASPPSSCPTAHTATTWRRVAIGCGGDCSAGRRP